MSTLKKFLDKHGLDRDKLAGELLQLNLPPTPLEAEVLWKALYVDSDAFMTHSAQILHAAARCLEWGAKPRKLLVEDIMLSPISVIESKAPISAAMDMIEHSGSDVTLLTKKGQWVGAIKAQTVRKAMQHKLGDQCVELISCGKPPSIPYNSGILNAKTKLSKSHHPVLIVVKSNRAVGIVDRESFCLGLAPQTLPKGWESRIDSQIKWLKAVGAAAEASHSKAYLVGGSVRDILLGEEPSDLDFTVIGDTIQCATLLHKQFGGELHKEPLFGAAHLILPDGDRIDITTGRSERYETPGSLPSISAANLRVDLQRRDFTVNMLALNVTPNNWGELIDPFGGAQDLAEGHLRVISGLAFTDDPTRLFRAARYASRLGLALHLDTADHLSRTLTTNLRETLSLSRIGRELELIFADRHPQRAFELLRQWGVLSHFWPEETTLIANGFGAFETALQNWKNRPIDSIAAGWVLMGSCFSKHKREKLAQMASRSSGSLKKWLGLPETLIKINDKLNNAAFTAPEVWGDAFYGVPTEVLVALDSLSPQYREGLKWWRETGQHIKSAVDGKLLISQGCPKGPQMGKAIRAAQNAAWSGKNEKAQLDAAKKTWMQEEI